jgi:hypothetical protein
VLTGHCSNWNITEEERRRFADIATKLICEKLCLASAPEASGVGELARVLAEQTRILREESEARFQALREVDRLKEFDLRKVTFYGAHASIPGATASAPAASARELQEFVDHQHQLLYGEDGIALPLRREVEQLKQALRERTAQAAEATAKPYATAMLTWKEDTRLPALFAMLGSVAVGVVHLSSGGEAQKWCCSLPPSGPFACGGGACPLATAKLYITARVNEFLAAIKQETL